MEIEVDDSLIDSLASLARLDLDRTEREALKDQLGRILCYFARLDELVLEEKEPSGKDVAPPEELRADVPGPSLPRDLLLRDAPREEDGFFAVPRVIEAPGSEDRDGRLPEEG